MAVPITEAQWQALKATMTATVREEFGAGVAETVVAELPVAAGWLGRFWYWGLAIWGLYEGWEILKSTFSGAFSLGLFGFARTFPSTAIDSAKFIYEQLEATFPVSLGITGEIARGAFGEGINAEAFVSAGFLEDPAVQFEVAGKEIDKLHSSFLDAASVVADFARRDSDAGSADNLVRFLGASIVLPVRAAATEIALHMLEFPPFKPLEKLDEVFIHSLGFARMGAAILRERANELIVRGMKRQFNRTILPTDYTQHQALQARARGLIDETVYGQVLDNEGVRLDVRAPLLDMAHTGYSESQAARAYVEGRIDSAGYGAALDRHAILPGIRSTLADMAEKDLSHASLQDLWEWGAVSHEDLKQHLRWQGYRESRATIEADLIELKRTRHLIDEKVANARRLFRDCVLQEWELRQYLTDAHYSVAEQTLVVEVELLNRRQRTWMSVPDMVKAASLGLMNLPDVATQMQCRGYTPGDTIAEIILKLQKELPQCAQVALTDEAAVTALQALGLNLGVVGGTLPVALLAFLQCLSGATTLLAPTAEIHAVPDFITGATNVRLTWSTRYATEASISPRIGTVPLSGETLVHVTNATSFTLTAKNALGETKAYALVRLEPKPATTNGATA